MRKIVKLKDDTWERFRKDSFERWIKNGWKLVELLLGWGIEKKDKIIVIMFNYNVRGLLKTENKEY